MRTILFAILVMALACRRPSRQLAATLTPMPKPDSTSTIADYTRYLKAGDELVALGNDPSWSLTINTGKNLLRFKSQNGDSITAPVPQRIADSDGTFRYDAPLESGRIKVLFALDSCIDKQSGQRFDYRVEVDVRGKNYLGCGVSLRQVSLLQDIWVLTNFQERVIKPGGPRNELPRLEISLTEGRVTGTTGCNRLNGRVQADSRLIQFGPLVTTRMACLDEAGRLESDLLKALNDPLAYQVGEGKLTLLKAGKPVMVFKKVD